MEQGCWVRGGFAAATALLTLALAPATASAGLMAAYERYEPGKGFEIGLVNVATGAAISLPAGVNTTDDELHPALSRDGRFLYFTRMRLLPSLSGDILPPDTRTIHRLDRQTGTVTQVNSGRVAGPAVVRGIVPTTGDPTDTLSYAHGPQLDGSSSFVSRHHPLDGAGNATGTIFNRGVVRERRRGPRVEATHGAVDGSPFLNPTLGPGRDRIMLTLAYLDATTGALVKSVVQLGLNLRQSGGVQLLNREFGSVDSPASHPMTRAGDHTVAFAMSTSGNFGIHTTNLPNGSLFTVPDPTAAPAAINTSAPEQMPAWSPDDLKLGFVRTASGRRRLAVFDATPGIQAVINTPVDIGPEAPTPQTRSFQDVWGGISLADAPAAATPTPLCDPGCLASLRNATRASVVLRPNLSAVSSIGIFVVRVTGKRKLLGRTVPRIRSSAACRSAAPARGRTGSPGTARSMESA